MNKYSVGPKMPRSGAPAIFMNSVYAISPSLCNTKVGARDALWGSCSGNDVMHEI